MGGSARDWPGAQLPPTPSPRGFVSNGLPTSSALPSQTHLKCSPIPDSPQVLSHPRLTSSALPSQTHLKCSPIPENVRLWQVLDADCGSTGRTRAVTIKQEVVDDDRGRVHRGSTGEPCAVPIKQEVVDDDFDRLPSEAQRHAPPSAPAATIKVEERHGSSSLSCSTGMYIRPGPAPHHGPVVTGASMYAKSLLHGAATARPVNEALAGCGASDHDG